MGSSIRLLPLFSIIAIAGCQPRRTADAGAEERAIRAVVTRWNELLVAKNDSAIAAIYAADAVLLPPNMPAVSGAGPIRQFWAALGPMNATLTLNPTQVTVAQAGDLASELGTWTFEAPSPQGAMKDTGKYVVVWRKRDGDWKAVQDIWNSDNPPPAAATQGAKPAK